MQRVSTMSTVSSSTKTFSKRKRPFRIGTFGGSTHPGNSFTLCINLLNSEIDS